MFRADDISGSFRFFFADSGTRDAPHIYVERDHNTCRFLLQPLELMRNKGFNPRELLTIRRLLESHQESLLESWKEHCEGRHLLVPKPKTRRPVR
jgi:hypothetical protein